MRVTILGAGAFGEALQSVLHEKQHEVKFYDPAKFPEVNLDEAVNWAEVLILAVPSQFAPELLTQIPDKNKPLVNTSKGFLSLAPFAEFPNFSLVSGGSFAEQILDKKQTILTATSDLATELFATDWLKIEQSSDQLGILLCGTLKNIYAIGAGERSLRPNTADFRHYIESALSELSFILAANGADPATVRLSCGKLDLVLTAASEKSRNYQFGQLVHRRNHIDLTQITATTEGLSAIQHLPASDVIIPENGAEILHEIIRKVTDATK